MEQLAEFPGEKPFFFSHFAFPRQAYSLRLCVFVRKNSVRTVVDQPGGRLRAAVPTLIIFKSSTLRLGVFA